VDLGLLAANLDIEIRRVVVIIRGDGQKAGELPQFYHELGARVVNLRRIDAGNRKSVLPLILIDRPGADLEHGEWPQKRHDAGNRTYASHQLPHFLLNRRALSGWFQKREHDSLV